MSKVSHAPRFALTVEDSADGSGHGGCQIRSIVGWESWMWICQNEVETVTDSDVKVEGFTVGFSCISHDNIQQGANTRDVFFSLEADNVLSRL